MNPETENPIPEYLLAMRGKLDEMDNDPGDLRHRMSSVERHPANLQGDVANIHHRPDTVGERPDRIEHRLELTAAPA